MEKQQNKLVMNLDILQSREPHLYAHLALVPAFCLEATLREMLHKGMQAQSSGVTGCVLDTSSDGSADNQGGGKIAKKLTFWEHQDEDRALYQYFASTPLYRRRKRARFLLAKAISVGQTGLPTGSAPSLPTIPALRQPATSHQTLAPRKGSLTPPRHETDPLPDLSAVGDLFGSVMVKG